MIWDPEAETMPRAARQRLQLDRLQKSLYPSELEAALLTLDDRAPHYQLVIDRTGPFPSLEVHVEAGDRLVASWGGFHAGRPELDALSTRVAERVRTHLGLHIDIAIVPPKTIPRSEGKAVRVVERPAARA